MKQLMLISSLCVLSAFSSCGPNAAEIAAKQKRLDDSIATVQRQHDDSVANAVRIATKRADDSTAASKEKTLQEKQALQNDIVTLRNNLESANADLAVARDEMSHIQQFQFGRSKNDRENQIRSQTMKIQRLQDRISSLQQLLSQKQSALSSFQ